jgi:Bacteriophage HK97-gp10, putative tail-component
VSDGARLDGAAAMREKLSRLAQKFPDEVSRALYQEVEVEVTECKRRTPVDTGNLRASIHQEGPERKGLRVVTAIVCGGPSAPYAVYVHEDLEAFHRVGQAKFIESVLLESRQYLAERIARRIDLNRAAT